MHFYFLDVQFYSYKSSHLLFFWGLFRLPPSYFEPKNTILSECSFVATTCFRISWYNICWIIMTIIYIASIWYQLQNGVFNFFIFFFNGCGGACIKGNIRYISRMYWYSSLVRGLSGWDTDPLLCQLVVHWFYLLFCEFIIQPHLTIFGNVFLLRGGNLRLFEALLALGYLTVWTCIFS